MYMYETSQTVYREHAGFRAVFSNFCQRSYKFVIMLIQYGVQCFLLCDSSRTKIEHQKEKKINVSQESRVRAFISQLGVVSFHAPLPNLARGGQTEPVWA